MIRYDQGRSQTPMAVMKGTIVGQLSRIYMKSSKELFFQQDALRMLLRMRWNGNDQEGVYQAIEQWHPRQAIHFGWRATPETTQTLIMCLQHSDRIVDCMDNTAELCAGVANRHLDQHIQEITALHFWNIES